MNTRSDEKDTGKDATGREHVHRVGSFFTAKQCHDTQSNVNPSIINKQASYDMKLFAHEPRVLDIRYEETTVDPAKFNPNLSMTLSEADY